MALLAATCSRIGETFQDDSTVFTQKNLCYEKGKEDVTNTKSCVDTRASAFVCLDRTLDMQKNSSPPYPPASQIMSPCFKVKHEENFDYNQNCEGMHICPNVIAEARMLEAQARVSFSKSCSHEAINTTICSHTTDNASENLNFSNSGCESAVIQGSPSSESSSCFYQNTSMNSSCAVENVNFQGSALAHLPPATQVINNIPSITQTGHYSNLDNFQRHTSKQFQPWQSQQQFHRLDALSNEEKSSCMMYDHFGNNDLPLQNFNNTHDRNNKNSLSHANSPTQPLSNFRSHSAVHQFFQTPSSTPESQAFQNYTNYNSSVDIKPDPFTINQQNYRQPISPCLPPTHNFQPNQHVPQSNMKWPSEPLVNAIQQGPSPEHLSNLGPPESMNHPLHNHPLGMNSSFCNTCNSQSNIMGMSNTSDMMGVNPIPSQEMQSQNLAEYQYQQQQMFYARDNRRPRRIACTCPNCRDGENKTVTTKDGKQRKLHVCHVPGCGKIYGKTSHLRAHLRWHAGERPFACNWLFCNKRFTRSDELQRHRRTHTGDKRFECSTCLKKFMRSDHLSKHMKTHQAQNKQNKEKNDNTQDKNSKVNNSTVKTKEEESSKTSQSLGISESLTL